MDADRFAKGFERHPQDYASLNGAGWTKARRSLMDPISEWSHFFSHLVDSHLTHTPVHLEETVEAIDSYTGEMYQQLVNNTVKATQDIAMYKPAMSGQLNTLNFHPLNQEFGRYWQHLASPEEMEAPSYSDLADIQLHLSIKALSLVDIRRRYHDSALTKGSLINRQDPRFDESIVGQITEFDAAIAIIELLKHQHPVHRERIVFVPAPPRYETFTNKASDFLLFDTEQQQARGIQVKTHLRGKGKYDLDYVSLVDGMNDLGNYRMRTNGSHGKAKQAMPGLIAADFILTDPDAYEASRADSCTNNYRHSLGRVAHARTIAESLDRYMDYSDRAGVAAGKLEERILKELYANPSQRRRK